MFTRSFALGPAGWGVRVDAVLPGPFWTPAIAAQDKGAIRDFGSFTMLRRPGQPEEIAPACVFLAADASFSTGALIESAGGFRAVD